MTTTHPINDSSRALGRLEISHQVVSCEKDGENETRKSQEASRKRLNGCVPLSHQVAGHKYGVDKVDQYLKLEDVTRKFIKPCIMDVKIGQRSYDPYASKEKKDQQIRKYPLMEEIGFLVLGMRQYLKPFLVLYILHSQSVHMSRFLV
ncbi:IPMK multikinase, partial [Polypterus senegalus]